MNNEEEVKETLKQIMKEDACKKCGATENVNFEGMCKKCYEDSIVINENVSTDDKKADNMSKEKVIKVIKEKSILIESFLIIFIFISIIISVSIYNSKEELQAEYNNLNSKYTETEKKLEESNLDLKKVKKEVEDLKQEDKQNEISKNIKALETKETELTTQKQELEQQISSLQADVVKIKGEPKTYPAGQLTAGTDVPVGKYKIYGGSSNFAVYSASGSLQVNIILGSGSYSVEEYIYTFKTGDKIKANSAFKLVEVK